MWDFFSSNIIIKFLPAIDNLERIITWTPEWEQTWAMFDGIKSIYSWLLKTLENFNVKPFETIGKEMDPNFHDVMAQLPWEDGIIIQEFEKGYLIWDKVLRHAKVVVGNG